MGKGNRRQSNFELLRIISMIMIVGCHFVGHGIQQVYVGAPVAYRQWGDGTVMNKVFSSLMLPGGSVGVAVFFMLSGYFMIEKDKPSVKRLFLESVYYGIIISVVYIMTSCFSYELLYEGSKIGFSVIAKALFIPVSGGEWWFVSAYFYLMLLSPILNRVIRKLDRKCLPFIVVSGALFIYCIPMVLNGAYVALERAVFLYSIGALYRLYKTGWLGKRKILSFVSVVAWALYSVLFFIYSDRLSSDPVLAGSWMMRGIETFGGCILATIIAIALLALFDRIDLGFNKGINIIATTTLGVYLLHESPVGRHLLWKYAFKASEQYESTLFPVYAVLTVFCVFILCSVVDFVRIKLIEGRLMNMYERIIKCIVKQQEDVDNDQENSKSSKL